MGKWINVKDRLPKKFDRYLTYSPDFTFPIVTMSFYPSTRDWDSRNGEIAHWQPLPKPPKKDRSK